MIRYISRIGFIFFRVMNSVRHIITAARPRQWIKNLGLFLPILFDGTLFHVNRFVPVGIGAIAFCLLSSSNYILNDLLDAKQDAMHPQKKNRPIAKSDLSFRDALGASLLFGLCGVLLAFFVGQPFFFIAFMFVFLHYLSYFFFRKVPIIDVLMIASGYMLRIMAGEKAGGVVMSVWFFLTVLSVSLLLALGKRRSELSLVRQFSNESFHYPEKILDAYISVFASSSFLAYTYFTFLSTVSEDGFLFRGYTDYIFPILGRKWMMLTAPFVLYAIMRYLQLVYSGKEVLINLVTKDKPLILTMICWFAMVMIVVYGIGGA